MSTFYIQKGDKKMSFLSGKCDLADHIAGLGGYYDKDGNVIESMSDHTGPCYSDIYQDFLIFKKQTGGVLHQYKKIKEITPNNHDFVASKSSLKVIKHVNRKSGFRESIEYTYEYLGKEYTAKELNKQGGVYITVDIHFDTLLELAMYFPYTISFMSVSDSKTNVVISEESYVERNYKELIQNGFETSRDHYNKRLVDYIKDLAFKYYDPSRREHVETITFTESDGKYIGKTSKPIDPDFELRWADESQSYHTPPIIIDSDNGLIGMDEEDFKKGLGNKALVYYVRKIDKVLYLQ